MGGCEGGRGQHWTRQLLGQHRKKDREGEKRGRAGGSVCVCVWGAKSCIGKMTLAELRGSCSLNHQPSNLPLSLFLPPICVFFRLLMKHSDRASARGLAFPRRASRKKSSFCTEADFQLPVHFSFDRTHCPLRLIFLERALIDSGKVQLSRVRLFCV